MTGKEHLKSPDDPTGFRNWLETYEETILPLIVDRYIPRTQIRKIFDGGCGLGASTLGVGRVFPQSEIWACSLGDEPLPQVREELDGRLHFEKSSIVEFLSRSPERFDLIVLAGVPYHGIEATPKHCRLLIEKVSPGGFFLAMRDTIIDVTSLQFTLMEPFFRMIELVPPTENDTAALGECFLWQKREE